MEFADEEEELLRDHEQSLRQLEVLTAFMSACLLYTIPACNTSTVGIRLIYYHEQKIIFYYMDKLVKLFCMIGACKYHIMMCQYF